MKLREKVCTHHNITIRAINDEMVFYILLEDFFFTGENHLVCGS